MDNFYKVYTLQEVFIHYCLNNDIDLSPGMHEEMLIWIDDVKAQMYYDMKIHETREEYEHCMVLKHSITNFSKLYQDTKKRFIV